MEANGIQIWIDGGWGIDALIGQQTRPHNDLDIAVQHQYVAQLRKILAERDYKEMETENPNDYNFVLEDAHGAKVDVHTYTFDSEGRNIYGIAYPIESLMGTGTIEGQIVRCIALNWVLTFHGNYEPDEGDLKDMQALIDKFGIEPPENYKNRL